MSVNIRVLGWPENSNLEWLREYQQAKCSRLVFTSNGGI
jgi:hypothetical protein